MVKAQTIKQAKAAFKARNSIPSSDREKRQMQRSIELDNRAWRNKEQEKRRTEAAVKRKAKEVADREDLLRSALGTQRQKDKFGYQSSQFHLKAFFKACSPLGAADTIRPVEDDEDDDDLFDADLMDDESLLEALDPPIVAAQGEIRSQPPPDGLDATAALHPKAQLKPFPSGEEDFSSFLDELGSSTQIERELQSECRRADSKTICTSSFGSIGSDFDLTVEDMEPPEVVEAPAQASTKLEDDRRLMPPPALLPTTAKSPCLMVAPPTKKLIAHSGVFERRTSFPISCKPVPAFDSGFTMSQLETFVDDDLHLTQVSPR